MTREWKPPPLPPPGGPAPKRRRSWWTAGWLLAVLGGIAVAVALLAQLDVGSLIDADETAKVVHEPGDETVDELVEAMAADPGAAGANRQITLMFGPDATTQQVNRVERQWRAHADLHLVVVMDPEELEAATGFPVHAIAAWAHERDLLEVERFVCSYSGRAGVSMVGIDDTPCNPPPTRAPEVVIEVLVDRQVTPAHRETIRHELEANAFYDDVRVDGGTDEPGTWTRMRLAGFPPGAPYVCPLVAGFADDTGVTVRETGSVDGCPEF